MNIQRNTEKVASFHAWVKWSLSSLNIQEVGEFLNSDAFLMAKIEAFGMENQMVAVEELNKRERVKAKELYAQALEVCKDEVLAEKELIKLFIIPPSFTSIFECNDCGTMPAKEKAQVCAWCEEVYLFEANHGS